MLWVIQGSLGVNLWFMAGRTVVSLLKQVEAITATVVEAIPAGGSGGCGSCMTMQGAARGPRTSMTDGRHRRGSD